MLACWLRLALGLQVAGALALAGHGFAVVLPFLLLLFVVAVQMAAARLLSPPRPGGFGALRAAFLELGAFFALYEIIMPFEGWWAGKDDPPARGRPYVLLVSGYLCNRALWWWMAKHLRRDGFRVGMAALEPPFDDIDAFAECLHRRLAALPEGTPVMLAGHSMGGLAARSCLSRFGTGPVRRLVTIASPHHGTLWAWIAPGRNARQMEPGCSWLTSLAPPPVPALAVESANDMIVVPPDSALLDGAETLIIEDLGHLGLVFSARLYAVLRRAVLEMQSFQDLDE